MHAILILLPGSNPLESMNASIPDKLITTTEKNNRNNDMFNIVLDSRVNPENNKLKN